MRAARPIILSLLFTAMIMLIMAETPAPAPPDDPAACATAYSLGCKAYAFARDIPGLNLLNEIHSSSDQAIGYCRAAMKTAENCGCMESYHHFREGYVHLVDVSASKHISAAHAAADLALEQFESALIIAEICAADTIQADTSIRE